MRFKFCTKCHKEKPILDFTIHSREKDGLNYQCRECEKFDKQKLYNKNKRKILDRNKKLLDKFPWRRTLNYIRARCNCLTNSKYYRYGGRGIKCLITTDELKYLWYRDKAYLMKKPSIDRINNDGDYAFDNCRYIELSENTLRKVLVQQAKAVYQVNKEGKIINKFISISEATRQTGINNISKVIRGLCKTAGGYYWKL